MSEWVEYLTFNGVSPMAQLRAENGHEEPWKVDYFGVGNENWGCGGNMLPEYYGNEYRRYQTYVRNYDNNAPIAKICCGANGDDYDWTETVLKQTHKKAPENLHGFMDGLSLHYYTVVGDWQEKGSATDFDEKTWYKTMRKTLYMETLLKQHGAIMDQYDPEQKIGMIVDEWGTWFDVEPGTNPGFLYQQNTMRDALVAGINLNLFNKHCNRVKMANIAQMVNVLQAVILTEGDQMVLTPTYHVFDMYQCHQEAELLESSLETESIGLEEENMVPNLTESVSMDQTGKMHITLTNLSLTESYPIEVALAGAVADTVTGTILSGSMNEHNTFTDQNRVHTESFEDTRIVSEGLQLTIPPCSVIGLEVTIK